ncbi:hypothetical protein GUITHDRAFT_151873 [Guillardia theta CCMP2712]|uniref:Uncharacterized protein n=2 Tax=Guillardia theta TaxID=55529 RepID=L1JJQ4_GUITC|nr:hypothetical protein GUITHDRAFT_151873 [Guillardia theta CCMP2712]EKX48379.1 hypothetical protein GUITHDRAFT_151873 [Guillardia theta CCMP2712]|eukprot:XP_005835359.1 hypothetical protein GUITHDRAFT_151873 [Guillardia theta CCMP2712]
MVEAGHVRIGLMHGNDAPVNKRRKIAFIALSSVAILVSALLVGRSNPRIEMQEKKARFEQLSGDLLGSLEQAMDSSVDNKVQSMMSTRPVQHVSSVQGYHKLLPFDPHPYVTQTQLDRLLAEKRELETKREAILRTLRLRREAAAAKAAKDAAALDRIRLERAVTAAKKRQLQAAQRAARAAASEMKQAAIAKQQAIHAAEVASARQKELEYMSEVNHQQAEESAQYAAKENVADDMQYQQDKSAVDSKLKGYLLQEKDLLRKIAAAEKVAAHGGKWPETGMPKTLSAKAAQGQLRQTTTNANSAESQIIGSIAQAITNNKRQIQRDRVQAQQLQAKEISINSNVEALKASDLRLSKELIDAELKRVRKQ